MENLTYQERIDLLEEAADQINEAIDAIELAVRGTEHQASAHAYIIAHLKNWANGSNPYDEHIPKLIDQMTMNDMEENMEDRLEEQEGDGYPPSYFERFPRD